MTSEESNTMKNANVEKSPNSLSYTSTDSTTTSEEEESSKEVVTTCISLIQYPKDYDVKKTFHEKFLRTEQSKKYNNLIYHSYAEIWVRYHLKEQTHKLPPTKFHICCEKFQLLFVSEDNALMYLDKEGKYLCHEGLQLLRYVAKWLNVDELYLQFVYGRDRVEFIRFQVVIVREQNYYKVLTTNIHIEYDRLLLCELFRRGYPKRFTNWYLFFEEDEKKKN